MLGGVLFLTHSRSRVVARALGGVLVARIARRAREHRARPVCCTHPLGLRLGGLVIARALGCHGARHPAALERGAAAALAFSRSTPSAGAHGERRGARRKSATSSRPRDRRRRASDGGARSGQSVRRRHRRGHVRTRTTRAAGIGSRGRASSSRPKRCRDRAAQCSTPPRARKSARDFLTWARFPFVEAEPATRRRAPRALHRTPAIASRDRLNRTHRRVGLDRELRPIRVLTSRSD